MSPGKLLSVLLLFISALLCGCVVEPSPTPPAANGGGTEKRADVRASPSPESQASPESHADYRP